MAEMLHRGPSLLCLCLGILLTGLIPGIEGQLFTPLLQKRAPSHQGRAQKFKLAHVFTRSELNEVSGNLVSTHTEDEFHFSKDGHFITLGSTSARNIHGDNLEWELIKIARDKIAKEAVEWFALLVLDGVLEEDILMKMNANSQNKANRSALKQLLRRLHRAKGSRTTKYRSSIRHLLDIIRELYPRLFDPASSPAKRMRMVLPRSDRKLMELLLVDFDQIEKTVPRKAKTRPTKPQPGVEWSYNEADPAGPSKWPKHFATCGGSRQSPINIVSSQVRERDFPPLTFRNLNVFQQNVTVQHNGHTAQVILNDSIKNITVSGGNLPGKDFVLEQFHFHWGDPAIPGSEHEMNGKRFPAEMHMVFLNKAYKSEQEATQHADGIAALAFFLNVQPNDNQVLGEIFNTLQFIGRPKSLTFLTQPIDFLGFLAPTLQGSYFRYAGSLTTPGCFEAVTWTIFEKPIGISAQQLRDFGVLRQELHPQLALVDNFRPPQPMNGRIVFQKRL